MPKRKHPLTNMGSGLASEFDRNGADVENDEFLPIQIRKNRLIVLNWESEDPEIVSFFNNKSGKDRARSFEGALKVGVVASNVVGTAERIDYIQREFSSLETKFNNQLDSTMEQLAKSLDDAFGQKGKFAEIVQDTFGDNGKVLKQIFDPNREGTPLYQLRFELEKQIKELQMMIGTKAAVEQITKKSPIHGLQFEDELEKLLSDIVKQRKGDVLESTATATGRLTKSKKGDFLLRFHEKPEAPLVIEAKDEAHLSLPEIQRTLKEAIENRAGAYGILVSKTLEALPSAVGWFNEYPENQLVIALGESGSDDLKEEILNIAVTWAHFKILLQSPRTGTLDVAKIETEVEKAETIIGRFKEILTQCTNLDKASLAIRSVCDEIKRDLHTELSAISTLVNSPPTK